jgi:hypothetical protein
MTVFPDRIGQATRGLCAAVLCFMVGEAMAAEPPAFVVTGHEAEMQTLHELHALHHGRAFTACTLWDAWLPHATLWTGPEARQRYRQVFLSRRIVAEGYVSMQQHRGMAHSEGWPFPAWQQSGGKGWHFSTLHEVWAIQNFGLKPLASAGDWQIDGAVVEGIDPARGMNLRATGDVVTITTPLVQCGVLVAPFVRLEWAAQGLATGSQAWLSWRLDGETEWKAERRAGFPTPGDDQNLHFANVPLYRQPGYTGVVARYRVTVDRAAGAQLTLKSLITAIDTRHPTTGSLFLHGSTEYFAWTRDLAFLRANAGRMRSALRFALDEFEVRAGKHVRVPWVGHDGRSGLVIGPDGTKSRRSGLGVGNNYWDLLPFGGHDAMATMNLCDALDRMAELEAAVEAHPEWAVPADGDPFAAADLRRLAAEVRTDFQTRFWNAERGRFVGWIDVEGRAHDHGFTFLNLEAIHYGMATPEQARSILDWIDGKRVVEGDTSTGADIYRWRFAPRATTRRNVEDYVWVWSGPETIPWGGQVQDGGAVLGFSYFDLMARLRTNGPDDAWRRLREILAWFREVQAEGGYRAYYAQPGRGSLQGGGTAGGLGLDQEFLESVLVPQVMLYGFMGFRPGPDGFTVNPRLPAGWPSLSVSGVHVGDQVLEITGHPDGRADVRPRPAASL